MLLSLNSSGRKQQTGFSTFFLAGKKHKTTIAQDLIFIQQCQTGTQNVHRFPLAASNDHNNSFSFESTARVSVFSKQPMQEGCYIQHHWWKAGRWDVALRDTWRTSALALGGGRNVRLAFCANWSSITQTPGCHRFVHFETCIVSCGKISFCVRSLVNVPAQHRMIWQLYILFWTCREKYLTDRYLKDSSLQESVFRALCAYVVSTSHATQWVTHPCDTTEDWVVCRVIASSWYLLHQCWDWLSPRLHLLRKLRLEYQSEFPHLSREQFHYHIHRFVQFFQRDKAPGCSFFPVRNHFLWIKSSHRRCFLIGMHALGQCLLSPCWFWFPLLQCLESAVLPSVQCWKHLSSWAVSWKPTPPPWECETCPSPFCKTDKRKRKW